MTILLLSGVLIGMLLAFIPLLVVLVYNHREKNDMRREALRMVQRETELLDRIMYQANQTWTPPPRPVAVEDNEENEELKLKLQGWESV